MTRCVTSRIRAQSSQVCRLEPKPCSRMTGGASREAGVVPQMQPHARHIEELRGRRRSALERGARACPACRALTAPMSSSEQRRHHIDQDAPHRGIRLKCVISSSVAPNQPWMPASSGCCVAGWPAASRTITASWPTMSTVPGTAAQAYAWHRGRWRRGAGRRRQRRHRPGQVSSSIRFLAMSEAKMVGGSIFSRWKAT